MQIRFTHVLLATTLAASSAMADARFSAESSLQGFPTGLQYVQNTLDSITESDLRRLTFYSERAVNALSAVVEAAETSDTVAQDNVNMQFRSAISRLADAGSRSGLSTDQIADFFTATATESFGPDFLDQVGGVAGGLDMRTLFRNVSTVSAPRTSTLDDSAQFLNALAEASQGLTLSDDGPQTADEPLVAARPNGPTPLANASENERAFIDRVVVKDNRWEVTVIPGDTLALMASALYGDSLSFNTIFRANQNKMRDANSLVVGVTILLPKP